jgi:hypothetical protein
MEIRRFEALAAELAGRQVGLPEQLALIREPAEQLRLQAERAVDAFRARARVLGAEHLTHVTVSRLEPDQKHVNCLQFSIERGRHTLLCVAIANADGGKIRLVGPFRSGKTEGPCAEHPPCGPEVEAALEQRILDLLREALAS